jgi:hypothetical protein
MDVSGKLIRSWMFVPGHRQRMIDKSLGGIFTAFLLSFEAFVTFGKEL